MCTCRHCPPSFHFNYFLQRCERAGPRLGSRTVRTQPVGRESWRPTAHAGLHVALEHIGTSLHPATPLSQASGCMWGHVSIVRWIYITRLLLLFLFACGGEHGGYRCYYSRTGLGKRSCLLNTKANPLHRVEVTKPALRDSQGPVWASKLNPARPNRTQTQFPTQHSICHPPKPTLSY